MTDIENPFEPTAVPAEILPPAVVSAAPEAPPVLPEAAFSFTVKSPRGNLFSIRGASPAQFAQNLQAAEGLLSSVVALEGPVAAPQAPQAQTVAPQAAYSQPASYQVAPADPNAPSCVHGARIHKSGISTKTNRPYSLWSCSEPQGPTQCKAIFG